MVRNNQHKWKQFGRNCSKHWTLRSVISRISITPNRSWTDGHVLDAFATGRPREKGAEREAGLQARGSEIDEPRMSDNDGYDETQLLIWPSRESANVLFIRRRRGFLIGPKLTKKAVDIDLL